MKVLLTIPTGSGLLATRFPDDLENSLGFRRY